MNIGQYIEFRNFNPYFNLAMEEYLVRWCEETQIPILCLWQNKDTVVVGRNQNVYTECNLEFAKNNNILIARRMTGGGAVYHDFGNLNYSIILPKIGYDKEHSTALIVSALAKVGVDAYQTGRNDICTKEGKISGNAYYSNDRVALHHGTVLYNINKEKMERVLHVSKEKIAKRGIASVKTRVSCLAAEYPNLSLKDVKSSIKDVYKRIYGLENYDEDLIDCTILKKLEDRYISDEWNYFKIMDYGLIESGIFNDSVVNLSMLFQGEHLKKTEISTDSIYFESIEDFKNVINQYLENNDVISIADMDGFFSHMPVNALTRFMKSMVMSLFEKRDC